MLTSYNAFSTMIFNIYCCNSLRIILYKITNLGIFRQFLFKIYMSYVHWNIVGGASDTPPVPYVSSGFVTTTLIISPHCLGIKKLQ